MSFIEPHLRGHVAVPPKKKRKKKIVLDASWSGFLYWPQITVLGIDPSISSTGWSVVDFTPLMRPRLRGHGTFTTASTGDMSMKAIIERSRLVYEAMMAVAGVWDADHVAIELPVPSARGVGSQSGSIAVTAVYIAMPHPEDVSLHHPTHTKKVVTTNGKASKQDVKAAVMQWLGTLPRTNVDVTDSISVSITYALEHLTEQPNDDDDPR